MRKRSIRLGLICTLSLLSNPGFANEASDMLANPAVPSDSLGEWIELYNPPVLEFNLHRIDFDDDGSNLHRFGSDLLNLPWQYLTLAHNATPGFVLGYADDRFGLMDGDDEFVVSDGRADLLRLDYGPAPSVAGCSVRLRELPMIAANFDLALATLTFGQGDIGSPHLVGVV